MTDHHTDKKNVPKPEAAAGITSEKMDADEAMERPLSLRLVLRLFGSMGEYLPHLLIGGVLCIITVGSDMYVPKEISRIIDELETAYTQGTLAKLSAGALIFPMFILYLISRIAGSTQWLLTNYSTNKAMEKFRQRFFAKLQSLSKGFYDRHKAGWLVARNTSDLQTIRDFLTFTLMIAMICATSIGMAAWQISRMSFYLLLPLIILIPPMVALSVWFKKHMSKAQRGVREQNSKLIANMAETVRGIRVVHAYSRAAYNLETYDEINRTYRKLELKIARLGALFLPAFDFLGVLNIVMMIGIGTWVIQNPDVVGTGNQPLSSGNTAAYILYVMGVLWPVRMLVEVYSLAIAAMASAERIFEILDMPADVVDAPDAIPVTTINGAVEFRAVSFRYSPDTPWIFKNLTVHIQPGETIALVGETGAGKTTFASLVARFHDVTDGAVFIDGHDVRQLAQDSLHQHMGIVLQQGYLFSGSVMENLRFARTDLSADDIIAIAQDLGTDEYIASLPEGYETHIIEGGGSLSLGQQQLIAITRAIVADPQILIMDEPTSSLDVFTERILQHALDRIVKNRTTILIAHRLSTVRNANRILVIAEGNIAEAGSHETLMQQGGYYRELVMRSEAGTGLLGISELEAEERDF